MSRKRKRTYRQIEYDPETHGPLAFMNWRSPEDVVAIREYKEAGNSVWQVEHVTAGEVIKSRSSMVKAGLMDASTWLRKAQEAKQMSVTESESDA